jgi:hypothetical protein
MNNKYEIEKNLKRFLKKKIAYTTGLLIAFLIAGDIGLASVADLSQQVRVTEEELLTKITEEKAEIQALLEENESKIREFKENYHTLLRKGDYYSKPLDESNQIFFPIRYENNGTMKDKATDRISAAFRETLGAIRSKVRSEGLLEFAAVSPSTVKTYADGSIGEDELLLKMLDDYSGEPTAGKGHSQNIELGVNIILSEPEIMNITKKVSINIDKVSIDVLPITFVAPSPVTITPPVIAPINVAISSPDPISAVSVSAPQAPTTVTPVDRVITITTPGVPSSYEPLMVTEPKAPVTPSIPSISVLTPPNITFNGTGFGQGYEPGVNTFWSPTLDNWDVITPTDTIYIETGTTTVPNTVWDGGSIDLYYTEIAPVTMVNPAPGGTQYYGWGFGPDAAPTQTNMLTPGTIGGQTVAFISDAADHSVAINGDWDFTGGSYITGTTMFVSLNPYQVGKHYPGDQTYDFRGTLTLHGDEITPGSTGAVVGFEHQELANGGGGGEKFLYVTTGQATSILKNSGTIDLNSGSNMIGFMIDSEAFGGTYLSSHFIKKPETINDGLMKISSGATNSIAFDYGYYYTASTDQGSLGPNNKLKLGNIEIDGTSNYGLRMKDYTMYSNNYYDTTEVSGENGLIKVSGNSNIGIGVYQGVTTDVITDTWVNPGTLAIETITLSNGYQDSGSIFKDINIEVDGNNNVGLYRNFNNLNSTDLHLTDAFIGNTFRIGATGTENALIRTDNGKVVLDTSIAITQGGVKNTVIQSSSKSLTEHGSTEISTTGEIIGTIDELYALTAGDFVSTVGSNITNNGEIQLSGEKSIGMAVAAGNTGKNTGNIETTGAQSTGIYNLGTYELAGGNIIGKNLTTSGIYNIGTITLTADTTIEAEDGAVGMFSGTGSNFNNSAGTKTVTISVKDTLNQKGVGVYAAGGTTNIQNSEITVRGGAAGISAVNAGTTVNLQGGKIDFDGQGYAAYSDGNGIIDLRNGGEIDLRGRSAGFKLDLGLGSSQVLFDNTSKITMFSNSAVAMTLTNINYAFTPVTLTALMADVESKVGSVPVVAGVEGLVTYDAFRLAATDGGDIVIDIPITKSADGAGPNGVWEESYFFYRSFLAQKSKLYIEADATAEINSTIADKFFQGQVSGIEMNSSTTATSYSDSLVDVGSNGHNVIVKADRTDAGQGAIGIYGNFSNIIVRAGSKVEIEKGANVLNDEGIGVFAVDGTVANNHGSIEIDGKNTIGMLGLAYRNNSLDVPIGKEFGGITGEGATSISNETGANIDVFGKEGIGMYALNNSNDPSLNPADVTMLTVKNSGNIRAGIASGATYGIGIYADGDVSVTNNGTITVGENGIGIYGVKGGNSSLSGILSIGNIVLGKDGTGVLTDGTVDIKDNGTVVFTGSYETGEKGKIAIAYVGEPAGVIETTAQTLNLGIDISGLDHGMAVYIKDKSNLTSTGDITVGNEGIGIYLDNGAVINTGDISLQSTGNKAVGMYSVKGQVTNNGTITVNNPSQVGITGKSSNAIVNNNSGVVALAANNTMGIAVMDGAVLSDEGTISFGSGINNSFGIVASNGSTINLLTSGTYTLQNVSKNIFAFGEKGSIINLAAGMVFDGVSVSGNNKSVGIYLDGSNGANSLNGAPTIILTAKNGIIGVYSKGSNTLTNGIYTSNDNGTVGIYFEDGGSVDELEIRVDAPSNAVGIYGAGGTISIGSNGILLRLGPNKGTGIYLTNGAYLTGGTITVSGTGTNTNPGVYYTGTSATHGTDIDLQGAGVVGLYADDGVNLTNSKDILFNGASNLIGAYVAGNSTYTLGTTSITTDVNKSNSTAIYAASGTGINKGKIEVSNANAAAMVAKGSASATGTIKNEGEIIVNSGVGMLIGDATGISPAAGISKGINEGIIEVNNSSAGVILSNYDNSKFDGTSGTIKINNGTGIYIKGTVAGQIINTGTLNLLSANSLGIYSDGAMVDFPVVLTSTAGTGVYATGTSTLKSVIDGSGSSGTFGLYMDNMSTGVTFNNAIVKAGNGNSSVGIFLNSMGNYTLAGVGTEAKSAGSIGIYVNSGNNLIDKATVTVDNGAVGVYIDGGSSYTTDGNLLNIGTNSFGIYNKGTANIGTIGVTTINFTGTNGMAVYNDGGTLNVGSSVIVTGTGTGSFAVTTNGNLSNTGTINISDGSIALLGNYTTAGTYLLSNDSSGIINATSGGIGMAAIGSVGTVILKNDGIIYSDGKDSVGIYTTLGDVTNFGTIHATNKGIGMYISGTGSVSAYGNVDVSGGVGIVVDGGTASGTGTITLNNGTANNYSIGAYFTGITGTLSLPSIIQTGSYTVGVVIEDSIGVNIGNLVVSSVSSTNQVGYSLKNSTISSGTINVFGDNNVGINAIDSILTTGAVTVGNSKSLLDAAVGVYIENGNATIGNVSVGKESIGIYGNKSNITAGDIITAERAVGIYATGDGTYTNSINVNGNMTVGANNSIGAYGNGVDINVNAPTLVTADKDVSVAVVSEGVGNVSFAGDMVIADKNKKGSIGIYKKGEANSIQSSGDWVIGRSGYAMYLIGEGNGIQATNNGAITLKESAVGIFADATNGAVTVTNSGVIDIGKTYLGPNNSHTNIDEHENSAGIYLKNGAKGYNTGIIIADEDHSVGVYAVDSGTYFENRGTIDVSNGSTGILAKAGSTVINSGTISILNPGSMYGSNSIGIAAYNGALVRNTATGIINAENGIGIYMGSGSKIDNQGTINVNNGIGIIGTGILLNQGIINVTGSGVAVKKTSTDTINEGSVLIDESGIKINGNYVTIGGTFNAEKAIILEGAYVDITAIPGSKVPLFTAPDVSGNIYLTPNFATVGNGYSYVIDNFVSALLSTSKSSVSVESSPMFIIKVRDDGSLAVVKKPYSDLYIGEQFQALTAGMDNILYQEKFAELMDSQKILKDLNAYLENIYAEFGEAGFHRELSRSIAEVRGDIYGTIQKRMQNVQKSFDYSFEEMLNSYNITKDSNKYSVMYTQGKYKDATLGIDNYDYRVQGLMYMKEYEGRNFGNKHGFSLGFAVSRFDFKDGKTYGHNSREDIYSIRAGLHNVKNFSDSDSLRLISNLELGYNRHEAKRIIELDKSYKNEGKYNTYSVTLDNRLEKTMHRDLSSKVDIYASLNLEYNIVDKFNETGDGLELVIKENDDFSIQPEIGITGSKRVYIGNKISAKLDGNASYAYELGDGKYENKAKIKNGASSYYGLIPPAEEKGMIKGKIGLTIENANKAGVTFEVEAVKHDNKEDADVHYGARFKYVL